MIKKPHAETGWREVHEHTYAGGIGFSFLGIILLAIGVVWLLQSLNIITIKIPWWPVILILFSLWLITRSFYR